MKTILTFIVLVTIQVSLTSCAYIYSKSDNVAAKVSKLSENKRFGLALDTLEFIQPDHFNYIFLMTEKKRVSLLASQYEKKSLIQAINQEKLKHWADAMNTYDTALSNIPKSKKLKKARSKFIANRDKYLNQLKNKLLVSKAKTLSKKTATTKEIAQVNPKDTKAKNLLSSHIREVKLTANKLIICAEDGLKNKDLQLAQECLTLASNLSTSTITSKKIKTLKKALKKARHTRSNAHKKSIKTISTQLSQVKTNSELIRYRNEILTIYRHDKSNTRIIKLKKALDSRISVAVSAGIKEGQDLYSQGRIQQALNQWNEILQLAPSNHKLIDYIDRGERVLKKLHSLSNNSTQVPSQKSGN